MSGSALIYWSGTGNTQAMAEHIAQGMRDAGAGLDVFEVSDTSSEEAAAYDKLALGCPAMGAEELEDGEFEPFFAALEPMLSGKKVALFGSYGWGDGEWMRTWEDRVTAAGGMLFEQGLILNEAPDDQGAQTCRNFGERLAGA